MMTPSNAFNAWSMLPELTAAESSLNPEDLEQDLVSVALRARLTLQDIHCRADRMLLVLSVNGFRNLVHQKQIIDSDCSRLHCLPRSSHQNADL